MVILIKAKENEMKQNNLNKVLDIFKCYLHSLQFVWRKSYTCLFVIIFSILSTINFVYEFNGNDLTKYKCRWVCSLKMKYLIKIFYLFEITFSLHF